MSKPTKIEKEAALLQQRRKAMGHTQKSLATYLACSKSAVIAWENCQNPIPAWVWQRLKDHQASLLPKFSIDEYAAMGKKASEKGMTIEQWIEGVIKNALLLGVLIAVAYVWASA